ncbi:VanZ family protein [Photobacterium lipolyticum]|nr:VanZ family protein [Photobacterium lipolyticum]
MLFACASLLKSIGWKISFFQAAEGVVGGDKVLHLIAAFYISLLVSLAVNTSRNQLSTKFINPVFIYLFISFSADELLQLLSSYRHFSFADLAANYVGLLLGWGISGLLLKTTTKDHEHR